MARYAYERWDYNYQLPTTGIQVGGTIKGYAIKKNGELDRSDEIILEKEMAGRVAVVRTEHSSSYDSGDEMSLVFHDGSNKRSWRTTKTGVKSTIRKTQLIDEIIAEEGTYPDNGIDGDYWYIKTRKVFPDLHIKVNGELRSVQSAWVKVGGVLKEVKDIYVKKDGQLKKGV